MIGVYIDTLLDLLFLLLLSLRRGSSLFNTNKQLQKNPKRVVLHRVELLRASTFNLPASCRYLPTMFKPLNY